MQLQPKRLVRRRAWSEWPRSRQQAHAPRDSRHPISPKKIAKKTTVFLLLFLQKKKTLSSPKKPVTPAPPPTLCARSIANHAAEAKLACRASTACINRSPPSAVGKAARNRPQTSASNVLLCGNCQRMGPSLSPTPRSPTPENAQSPPPAPCHASSPGAPSPRTRTPPAPHPATPRNPLVRVPQTLRIKPPPPRRIGPPANPHIHPAPVLSSRAALP